MRRMLTILLIPLIMAGLVVIAEAAEPSTIVDVTAYNTPAQAALIGSTTIASSNITVYDSAGKPVSSATAVGSSPQTLIPAGYPRDIMMSANLPCQLSVSLSGSRVDWTINSVGDYRVQVAKIDVTTNLNSDVTMKVAGAGNLVNTNDSKQSLDTYYNFRTASGTPATNEFTAAASFNGDKKITVGNGAGTGYLWNRINAATGKPAGTYSNSFTVTFSQTL
ncbi:MAG: hypothetical protein V2A64_06140 [Candidatus Omnitrophota bacterium]